ncbi:holo-ACP synthase [Melioribacteraceae bacterium 4301-Me]|uniref:holo-ACP synthase n=1 Tax=Pyranulibacter aquaticus TaxID=3163344 RepID=UPI003596786F
MVLGVGIDIIEIDRIKRSVEKYGEQFLHKIFTETEISYSLTKANKYQHLAARFAAKEAIAKALATGWGDGFKWKDIEIFNEKNGMPKVKLAGKLAAFVGKEKSLKITMSHSDNYVACFAILYQENIAI